jgi:hypothetical protein
MADTLTNVSLEVNFLATLTNALTNSLAAPFAKLAKNKKLTLTDGTIINKADKVWGSEDRALSSGANEEIDLYDLGSIDIGAGAGKDPLGGALALAEVVALLVVCEDGTADNAVLTVGGATAATGNEFNSIFGADTDLVKTKRNGFIFIAAPGADAYAVADTTNHKLKIAAVTGNVVYSIYVLGRSA